MLTSELLPKDNIVYKTLTELGFSFTDPERREDKGKVYVKGRFTCMCGNEEVYKYSLDTLTWEDVNRAYGGLGVLGVLQRSFSYKHLLADGYSEEKAREISDKIGAAFVAHRNTSGATCIY